MATASKGPLNYTTTIDPVKSMGECTAILIAHGAKAIGTTFDDGNPTGLTFQIETIYGPKQFSLPVNVTGTQKALLAAWRKGRIPQRFTSTEQAHRVAWRVLKDWLEVQIAFIDAGVAEITQVMLPYVHVDHGVTLWESWQAREQLALEAGSGN